MTTQTVSVRTDRRLQVLDVTDQVGDAVPEDADGTVTVFSQHTTAAVIVNEAESRLLEDVEEFLATLVPEEGWAHDEVDDNADSHLRASLLGPSETLPVVDGGLQLGTWQSVLLVECDGPRSRVLAVAH
ncbi:MAG: secondary thiamine-phosphate synthase enzyme YjbQ [Haloarculaceae archaeon]